MLKAIIGGYIVVLALVIWPIPIQAQECGTNDSLCPPNAYCDTTDHACHRTSDRTPVVAPPAPGQNNAAPQPGGGAANVGGAGKVVSSKGIECKFGNSDGVLTAIGCIPYDPVVLVNNLVSFLIMAGGGIALLLMSASAVQMMMQGSDVKSVQAAQQRFIGAAVGLIFMIFSVLLLKIIGVNILQIPGFK